MFLQIISYSVILAVLNISVEQDIPNVAAASEVAHIHAVMVIMVRDIGNQRKHSERAPIEVIP